MLIPSIDIINNDAVQLVGGEGMALNAGSPGKIAATFGLLGPIAVIDPTLRWATAAQNHQGTLSEVPMPSGRQDSKHRP